MSFIKPFIVRSWSSALYPSEWVCAACTRRASIQSRLASTASVAQRNRPTREPLPLVGREMPKRGSKAPPLKPLMKPIGQQEPPVPGDNPHYDVRTRTEKLADYFNRHEAKRQWLKPAFQSWGELRHHLGKTFLSTPRPIMQEYALYFPNFQGYTSADFDNIYDTTKVLQGRISIVRVMSEYWSKMQCDTYTDEIRNPELHEEMARLKSKGLQFVHINIMERKIKSWLIWMFKKSYRKEIPEEEWPRCFMVSKGVTDYVRRDIEMPNPSVGHIYLVDQNCKIRWAGCGDATDEERESLVSAVRRLAEPKEFIAEERERAIREWQKRGTKQPA